MTKDGMRLIELAPVVSAREVQEKTEAALVATHDLKLMSFPT